MNAKSQEGRITAFLRWWAGELLALVPPLVKEAVGLSGEILLLSPQGEGFIAHRMRGEKQRLLGPMGEIAVRAQIERLRNMGAECVLRLPAEQGLRRQASIAVSALPRGFDAVAGEIERQTPFAPDQVYLGYRVEDVVDPRGRVMAYLALAPCAAVDAHLGKLAAMEMKPDRVTLADEVNTAANPVGDTVHILNITRKRSVPRYLLVTVTLTFIAALLSPQLRNAVVLSDMQAQLGLAKEIAANTVQSQRGGGDVQAQINYLSALRLQRPPVITVLDAISRALPDTAHLAQFELSANSVSLQGVARAAPDLVAPLEALPLVAKVEFSAPTLRDPAAALEQFQLTLTLRGYGWASKAQPQ